MILINNLYDIKGCFKDRFTGLAALHPAAKQVNHLSFFFF